ncbi:Acetyltransferase (GNAT) family [seawater metagenome]|uniref:Acetyltransferase (GNAT) family n=1 Tax=seawater metagenome TaxID=1561972 RepID=A0A5E8CI55_9ZZZZ
MYNLRPLLLSDYYKNYLNLLKQLSVIEKKNTNYLEYAKTWFRYSNNKFHKIIVIEEEGEIIAQGTLFLEPKFIHNNEFVGHLEDIVVDKRYHNKGISKLIIEYLKQEAIKNNCYKIILSCKNNLIEYYSKFNFKTHEIQMRLDLEENFNQQK